MTVFLVCTAILFCTIVVSNHGQFSYTLDDPYIHLALAERLAHGHYGINAGEMVTPSSSILWPWLLVPGAGTAWHPFLPLAYNLVFGAMAAWLMGVIARDWEWLKDGPGAPWRRWTLALLLVLSGNLAGLALTGMEHVLQGLLAVVCAFAVVRAYDDRRVATWCICLVAAGPAVRYESMVLCLALAVALTARGRLGAALMMMAGGLAAPVAFAVFLVRHGLPPLPNSVLAKGAAFASHGSMAANLLFTMGTNAVQYVVKPARWPATILLPLLLLCLWRERRVRLHRTVLAGAAAAVLLQMLAGSYGWFHRYEVYTGVFSVLVILSAASISRHRVSFAAVVVLLAFVDLPYMLVLIRTPVAAENIREQQYEMHRFVQLYGGNFAANDIGWVSYRLPPSTYMLDLEGLSSSEALRQRHKDAAWLDAVTRAHGIGLVLIYPEWFESLPADWRCVARLTLGSRRAAVAHEDVYLYETPYGTPRDRERLSGLLPAFARGLPPRVTFTLDPPAPRDSSKGTDGPAPGGPM